ncbi:DUF5677 domain-containing protein [Modestobacter sp. VKM Ac-2984]|uniref:DUF5677 domain-containing protein n=1 Tax=Modestobacter sp. VKM Ac-2984 TaxID=3004138 RepID=UPI0022AA28F6|nr:DUF5677 domain-containing protein [Modestobacter sp. VKM Ac-2984]MCZ2818178.1 hypothetical protein [Modestobacter sp. VKM Ac-2984]
MNTVGDSRLRQRLVGLRDEVAESAPAFTLAADSVADALLNYLDVVYDGEPSPAESFPTIFSQGCNDLLDLLAAAIAGHGRPAMRAARAVFESAIAFLDVTTDGSADKRYMDHLWVTAYLESGLSLGEDLLTPEERAAEEDRRRCYRASAEETYAELVSDEGYGRRFVNGWARGDLAGRARAHGHEHLYAPYKVASGVIHAGAGGGYGTENLIGGRQIVRTGPALAICPLAAIYGLRSFRLMVPAREQDAGHPLTILLVEALDDLEEAWPAYRRAMMDLDARTWPTDPPEQGLIAVAHVSVDGSVAWYVANQRSKHLALTSAPARLPVGFDLLVRATKEADSPLGASAFFMIDGLLATVPAEPTWTELEELSPGAIMMRVELPGDRPGEGPPKSRAGSHEHLREDGHD